MSEQGQEKNGGRLPLPSPQSPGELDRRILAYAQDNAPGKPALSGAWLGGVATTAALFLGLYLSNLADHNAIPPATEPMREEAGAVLDALEMPLAEQEMRQSAPAAKTEFDSPGTAIAKRVDTPLPRLESRLEELRELLEKGDAERAHREYARLLEACGGCDLPPTLEEALAPRN